MVIKLIPIVVVIIIIIIIILKPLVKGHKADKIIAKAQKWLKEWTCVSV